MFRGTDLGHRLRQAVPGGHLGCGNGGMLAATHDPYLGTTTVMPDGAIDGVRHGREGLDLRRQLPKGESINHLASGKGSHGHANTGMTGSTRPRRRRRQSRGEYVGIICMYKLGYQCSIYGTVLYTELHMQLMYCIYYHSP